MGFFGKRINWITECITMTSFKIIVIGNTRKTFNRNEVSAGRPNISIHFDNLLRYLGLYICFMSTRAKYGICIKLTKDNPNIPYLMFVDDRIIFGSTIKKAASMSNISWTSTVKF